jgi:hypothetical protein
LNGVICPACCGENRVVRIQCPEDCIHLKSGETYQKEKRSEKALASGRDYLRERLRAFKDQEELHFLTVLERTIHILHRAGGDLTDEGVKNALDQLPMHLGTLEVVVAAPHPLALALARKIKGDPALEAFRKRAPDRVGALVRTLGNLVEKKAGLPESGCRYLDFIATYHGALVSDREVREEWERLQGQDQGEDEKDPPGGIIIP